MPLLHTLFKGLKIFAKKARRLFLGEVTFNQFLNYICSVFKADVTVKEI
jgi:hypothetical protein